MAGQTDSRDGSNADDLDCLMMRCRLSIPFGPVPSCSTATATLNSSSGWTATAYTVCIRQRARANWPYDIT